MLFYLRLSTGEELSVNLTRSELVAALGRPWVKAGTSVVSTRHIVQVRTLPGVVTLGQVALDTINPI